MVGRQPLLNQRWTFATSPTFDEDRIPDDVFQFLHRTIEAFDMSDMQHGAALLRQLEKLLCLGECGGNRLLDEDMDAGLEKLPGPRHAATVRLMSNAHSYLIFTPHS